MMLFAILVLTPYVLSAVVKDGACNNDDGWYEAPGGWCLKLDGGNPMNYDSAQSTCTGMDANAKVLSATTSKKITDTMADVATNGISFTVSYWLRGDGFGWYDMKGEEANVFYHDTGYSNFKTQAVWDAAKLRNANAAERMFIIADGTEEPQGTVVGLKWDFAVDAAVEKNVVCEVCIDESQCGREALTKMGPHQIEENQQDCPSGTFKTKSYKMCDDCKCANHGKNKGAKLIDVADNPRLECERLAIAAGATYYSFIKVGPGFRKLGVNKNQYMAANRYCQFDQRSSTGEKTGDLALKTDCEDNQVNKQSSPALQNPWSIYKLFNTCKTCAKVIFDEPCTKCKCSSVHHIKFRKKDQQEKAASKQACAEKAYEAGFMYASYRDDDEKFCYYGHEKSTEEECMAGKRRENTKAPWSILEIQCLDETA